MSLKEAIKIYDSWRNYVEIDDKLSKIFGLLPLSFLPYPKESLTEALNIIAEKYWNDGDKEMSNTIQTTMCSLMNYVKDEESIESMSKSLDTILKHSDLKETKLRALKDCKDFWLKETYILNKK